MAHPDVGIEGPDLEARLGRQLAPVCPHFSRLEFVSQQCDPPGVFAHILHHLPAHSYDLLIQSLNMQCDPLGVFTHRLHHLPVHSNHVLSRSLEKQCDF